MSAETAEQSQARFVFRGTVQKLNAATLPTIADTNQTIVVRIDQIIRGPDVCKDFVGRQVTVQVEENVKFKQRQQGIFYTNVWLFGEGLAVKLLAFEPEQAVAAAVTMAAQEDPADALKRHDLQARVESADVVLSGKVTSVRFIEGSAPSAGASGGAALTAAPMPERVSEHAPLWQEATVQVDTVHKGTYTEKTAVVRFPGSTDVRWYKAPKLTPLQSGVFILHADEERAVTKGHAAVAELAQAAPGGAQVFTALHPGDFQPFDHTDINGIKNLLEMVQPKALDH
jgi:hypothetical protein